jgi:hypothetical protein
MTLVRCLIRDNVRHLADVAGPASRCLVLL